MTEQPLRSYHFQVEWGGARLGFSEVSGLEIETRVVEYREGSDRTYAPRKLPGLTRYSNITLKRGIVAGDNEFFEWMRRSIDNVAERRDLVISLLDADHEPVMVWKAARAFPVRLVGPQLRAAGNEVAIETMEVAHEGLSVETG